MSELLEAPAGAPSCVDEVSGVFGDGFVWFEDDSVRRRFDPVTDIRVAGDGPLVSPGWMAAVVEHCSRGLAVLEAVDPDGFDAETVTVWAMGVERLRRQIDGVGVAVADHVDAARPFVGHGFFTAKAWLKHTLQLSGAEAHARVQEARLRRVAKVWNNALAAGLVGVAQTRVMARIAANPRIAPDVLVDGVWNLMADAMDVSFEEFERLALTWEALADPIGAVERAERNRVRRVAVMRQMSEGGWELHARFDDVGGPEFLEMFCHDVDREFERDWAAAVAVLGEGNVDVGTLRRSEAQRRADALVEMARAAAACPPDAPRPLPMVNFVLDERTAAAGADNELLDPAGYRNVVSRTDRGDRVDPAAIIGVSMWALIRRVVIDADSVVIDLGRTSRLFTGFAREAVMLLEAVCVWPGCDHPHSWCHADHLTSWSTRGPTSPDNGAPLCPRHNYLKETGFRIERDDHGRWHIITPDGTDIC